MNDVPAACLLVAAYLCGSLPTGVWAGRRAGVDVRRSGSGNIGATNVARTAGARPAALTLGGDIAKGLIPVVAARWLSMSPWVVAGVGVAALLGHIYSIFLRFSGGKGVATAFGAFLGMAPAAAAVALVLFAVVAATTRYASLASVVAALTLAGAGFVMGYTAPIRCAMSFGALVILLRHRPNLARLWRGTEPRFELRH